MTTTPVTPELLRQRLGRILEKHPRGVVGIQASGPWQGKDRIRVGEHDVRVVWCPSVLAVREQLAANEEPQEPLAILTDQSERSLGVDVIARLVRNRVHPIDRWRLLEEVFQADRIDPRLVGEAWLVDGLLVHAPAEGYPAVPLGFLDADTAWATYLSRRFGFPEGRSELPRLLEWSIDAVRVAELAEAAEPVREAVLRRFGETAGVAGRAIGELVEAGRGHLAFPLGLALGVVFHEGEEGKERRKEATIRLEALVGGTEIDASSGRRWAQAAAELLPRFLASDEVDVGALLAEADALLRELKLDELAHLSNILPSGLRQRMARYADQVRRLVEQPSGERGAAREAAGKLLEHVGLEHRSSEAVRWSWKLLGALANEPSAPRSLPEAAKAYTDHGAFVDLLLEALRGTEVEPVLSGAYQALLDRVGRQRDRLSEQYGQYLAGWFSADDRTPELVPVESILEEVLAPAAGEDRVLFIVVDGLSLPVYQQVQADMLEHGWKEIVPRGAPVRRYGLSLLPSVTQVCRASLLTGARTTGVQAAEKKAFEGHGALRSLSKGGSPPVLFHKAELRSDAGGALAEELRREIANPSRRIVGVVVNAIDDYLQNSEQLRTAWDLGTIQPLGALLEAAAASERLVVLTSDHGHVLEHGLEKIHHADSGDRYRRDHGEAGDGEVVVAGPRVVAPGHRIVVPWSDRIRYGKRKTGYHGGASLQEMLVPVAVFSAGESPDGWREVGRNLPEWWLEPSETSPRPASSEEPTTAHASKRRKDETQGSLFPTTEPAPRKHGTAWISDLFASEVYAEQRALSGRTAPPDDAVRDFLVVLEQRGGGATRMALSQALDKPPQRIDSLVAAVARLLNVEGYAALEFDRQSGHVQLNRNLLREQFELS